MRNIINDIGYLIGQYKRSNNAEDFIRNTIGQNNTNDKITNNLINMARNNDERGLENMTRNFGRERGISDKDINDMVNTIKKMTAKF